MSVQLKAILLHADEPNVEMICMQTERLAGQGFPNVDLAIFPLNGKKRSYRIYESLISADILILLLTNRWLASSNCHHLFEAFVRERGSLDPDIFVLMADNLVVGKQYRPIMDEIKSRSRLIPLGETSILATQVQHVVRRANAAINFVPEGQKAGLQFASETDGRIGLQRSGRATRAEIDDIRAMRGLLIDMLDELSTLLIGSNAHSWVERIGAKYKAALLDDEISIDILFFYGNRLQNARLTLQKQIENDGFPEMTVQACETLDSIIALHGPLIYSTQRGRDLLERVRGFAEGIPDLIQYTHRALEVASVIEEARDIATGEVREVIGEVATDISQASTADSKGIAGTTLANFLIAAAKGIQMGFHPSMVESSVSAGVKEGHQDLVKYAYVGTATVAALAAYQSVPHLWGFFTSNLPLLHQFGVLAGSDLSWLPSFLNWVERQRPDL